MIRFIIACFLRDCCIAGQNSQLCITQAHAPAAAATCRRGDGGPARVFVWGGSPGTECCGRCHWNRPGEQGCP